MKIQYLIYLPKKRQSKTEYDNNPNNNNQQPNNNNNNNNNNNKLHQNKKMSQEKPQHQQDPKGASRRSRKDEHGRDYVCGCGKRYLSYPALYTHIKTKHDGLQPEGTQKTGALQIANRRIKQKLEDRVLKDILNLVPIQNLKILTQLDQNAHGCVAVCNRIKKQFVGRQIIQAFHHLTKINTLALDKKSSLETILVCYLLGVGQYTCQSMLQYYSIFARLFRNCFHDHAQQIYNDYFKSHDTRKNKIINIDQCKMSPIICDFFIRFYIPHQNKDHDFQSVMELICCDFCQWMFINKFTIVQTTMNYNYQISKRNLIETKNKKNQEENIQREEEKDQKQQSDQHHSSANQSPNKKQDGKSHNKNHQIHQSRKKNNQIPVEGSSGSGQP